MLVGGEWREFFVVDGSLRGLSRNRPVPARYRSGGLRVGGGDSRRHLRLAAPEECRLEHGRL